MEICQLLSDMACWCQEMQNNFCPSKKSYSHDHLIICPYIPLYLCTVSLLCLYVALSLLSIFFFIYHVADRNTNQTVIIEVSRAWKYVSMQRLWATQWTVCYRTNVTHWTTSHNGVRGLEQNLISYWICFHVYLHPGNTNGNGLVKKMKAEP